MRESFFTIKQVTLNNHCPECYSTEGLSLTFKQKFVEAKLYKAISKETTYNLFCNNCNTVIYPSRWTDDIELVFAYQEKATTPKPTSYKLTQLGWITTGVGGLLLAAVVGYFFMS